MKIALIQLKSVYLDEKENLARVKSALGIAARLGADLALLPELTLTGFTMQPEQTGEINAGARELLSDLSRELCMNIGLGYIEENSGKYYNKYAVAGQSGEILCDYAKIHPFSYTGEDKVFSGGDKLASFKLSGFQIGISICYDLRFPALYQLLSRRCGLIVVAANWPASRRPHWDALLRARAIENQCYIAGVNIGRSTDGYEYDGGSALVDPYGRPVSELAASDRHWDIYCAEADMELVTKYELAFPVKRDRREALYKRLSEDL